ncbi:MAG: flagellar biosynthesis protein FlhA [Candidatus Sumerlaeia bacterium]|nr:flagellar biosynthesis protein FlhA [Candidatus Sumerlaeia bacterium]
MATSGPMQRALAQRDLFIPLALFGVLLIMVLPIPTFLLDLLLTLSITAGLLILMTALYTLRPLDFSVFPAILLMVTLFRLSLNVATTRVILLHGNEGPDSAGHVIQAFGQFVVGGNYAVGIIVFIILVIINFVVITKGAGRVAEVSARFTLDAMPGKQMSIDADLNAGLIDEAAARRRRQEIEREADFYGAMDGASKFVRGDAIAGIIITLVNIIAGFFIGIVQHAMDVSEALERYTILTIGDGLVAQIPALIISTAAGIVVTRATSDKRLSENVGIELMGRPRPLAISAGLLAVMALVPGLPTVPFGILAILLGVAAYVVAHLQALEHDRVREEAQAQAEAAPPEPEKVESLLSIDLIALEVGYGLIALVDGQQSGELLERIKSIRRQLAQDMGFVVPPLHIRDNLELKPGGYSILIKGVEVARGDLITGHLLAMSPDNILTAIDGIPTVEPAFGLPAVWIPEHQKEKALATGYTVVDLSTVVATHLTEVLKAHAHELLGRQETQNLIDGLKKQFPKVVDGVVPEIVSLGLVQKVLQNLLRERVSVRDLLTIVETLAECGTVTKDPDQLTDHVRQALARTITRQFLSDDGTVHLIMLDQAVEDLLIQNLRVTEKGTYLVLEPSAAQRLLSSLSRQIEAFALLGAQPLLVVLPALRSQVRRLVERFLPQLSVISHSELLPDAKIHNVGVVRLADAA